MPMLGTRCSKQRKMRRKILLVLLRLVQNWQ